MNVNDFIARAAPGSEVVLPSGEFEGPLVIDKPLRLRGKNTTVWAKKSPVIEINSNGVTIEDIRAEITEGCTEEPAVKTTVMAAARNVEVLGRVAGFGAEDGYFDVPRTIDLGRFPSDRENSYRLEVNVPAKTEVVCELREVTVEPRELTPGRNTLIIKVNGISAAMFLYAEVLFKSQFTRRTYILGKPDETASAADMKDIYCAPERDFSAPPSVSEIDGAGSAGFASPSSPKTDVISMPRMADPTLAPLDMQRGQRVGLSQYLGEKFEVWFTSNAPRGTEIDPYVFLLQSGDKAVGDEGLVFFGNESSQNGEVKYFASDGHIEIDLAKISPQIQKISLAYSIYDGGANRNFRSVLSPRVSLRGSRGERVVFSINGLSNETTIVALEFYLYKGEWKISAIGAGYKDGLARLCNSYGIEVEG